MGKNNCKIIELYGLPGSGKSSLINELKQIYRKDNYNVYYYSDYLKMMENGHKKVIIREIMTINGLKTSICILSFLIKNHLIFKDDILKRIMYCFSFITFYRLHKNENALIIMDEGIVQGVISALYKYTNNNLNFLWLTRLVDSMEIYPYFLDVSVNIANERIINRNTKSHGRCDMVSCTNERIDILFTELENFKIFQKFLSDDKRLVLDSSKNNSLTLANEIKKFLTKE